MCANRIARNVLAIPTGLFYVNFISTESPECGDPEKPIYGIVEVQGDHQQVAHYSCIPGYIRRGNASRTCTWAGWRPVAVPECIGMYLREAMKKYCFFDTGQMNGLSFMYLIAEWLNITR